MRRSASLPRTGATSRSGRPASWLRSGTVCANDVVGASELLGECAYAEDTGAVGHLGVPQAPHHKLEIGSLDRALERIDGRLLPDQPSSSGPERNLPEPDVVQHSVDQPWLQAHPLIG